MPSLPPLAQIRRISSITGVERGPLLGAVTFIEGVALGWGCWELTDWFEVHVVAPGGSARAPAVVHERAVGSIVIDPRGKALPLERPVGVDQLPALLLTARTRVVETVAQLLPPEPDDRFIEAAVAANRLERRTVRDRLRWVPVPTESDELSDVVLSLFAADILDNRAFYESHLCVCSHCGRVSFESTDARNTCGEHRGSR